MEFPKFPEGTKSLVCKHLTQQVFDELKDKTSKGGFTLKDVVNSGVVNPESGVGCYAGDEDSYVTFASFFDNVIDDYHGGYKPDAKHVTNMNVDDLKAPNPDPEGDYVISTRIRVGRNIKDTNLSPGISREQRKQVESDAVQALSTLTDDLSGTYYPLDGMKEDDRKRLVEDHFLFKKGDKYLEAAGANRDWPESRGIFHSDDKKFLVWINEEDQLRIISMQKGGDIGQVFDRLCRAIKTISDKIEFAHNEHLGYISSCPTNLGTAMRASVHIKLPALAKDTDKFNEIVKKHQCQIRGIHGEHSESKDPIFDISNKRRLGLSEVQCVQDMYDCVKELIATEKQLA